MNRSDHERLTDELIGEATLFLLKDNGPISMKRLLERLNQMLKAEQDNERRNALAHIILDISSESTGVPGQNTRSEQQTWDKDGRNGSNVYPLFGDSQRANSKKH